MKTGFLLPRSTVYPLIGHDFLDGCKSYLQHTNLQIDIRTDNIGFGLDEKEVYSKSENMLLSANADVVVAFVDGRCADMLQPLFTATGKILLLVNMGAHFPQVAAVSSTVLHHNFNVCLNSYLTGKLPVQANHSKAVMATSYYDGGYLLCYAMVSAYQQMGGAITYNYISHFKRDEFNTSTLKEFLAANPDDDTVFCIYSGDVSPLIYQSMMEMQQQHELHFYVSPMMLDEALKDVLGVDFKIHKVKGYTSWLSSLEYNSNQIFLKKFNQFTGRNAGIFSLLGWETGILLQQIQALLNAGIKDTTLIQELRKIKFESPRGWLQIDEQTNHTFSPSYLVSASGNFDLAVTATKENLFEERKAFHSEKTGEFASGWRNTYLCS